MSPLGLLLGVAALGGVYLAFAAPGVTGNDTTKDADLPPWRGRGYPSPTEADLAAAGKTIVRRCAVGNPSNLVLPVRTRGEQIARDVTGDRRRVVELAAINTAHILYRGPKGDVIDVPSGASSVVVSADLISKGYVLDQGNPYFDPPKVRLPDSWLQFAYVGMTSSGERYLVFTGGVPVPPLSECL